MRSARRLESAAIADPVPAAVFGWKMLIKSVGNYKIPGLLLLLQLSLYVSRDGGAS